MRRQIREAYDALAEPYFEMRMGDGFTHFYNEMVEMPTTLKLLGQVKNKHVLDLGCGPGRYAEILTNKGAKVIGIDNSRTSLNIAEKQAPKAQFILHDIEKKLPFKAGQFDIVVSSMVIGHLNNWSPVFNEVKRVLKKNGIFVFSIYNPFRMVLEKEKWFFKKFRVVRDYFTEREVRATWRHGDQTFEVAHYHKTYGTIIKHIVNNGFELIDYEDCKPLRAAKVQFPNKYAETIDIPNFCTWKLKKK